MLSLLFNGGWEQSVLGFWGFILTVFCGPNFSFLKKSYFIDYVITVVQFFLMAPSTQHPSLPQAILTPLLMSMDMHISSLATPFPILYFTAPWLFCNYLFVLLKSFISLPIIPHPSPIWQPWKPSRYPWLCLCSCLLSLFLDSIVDRYVFIAILLFITLMFFFLKKSL